MGAEKVTCSYTEDIDKISLMDDKTTPVETPVSTI